MRTERAPPPGLTLAGAEPRAWNSMQVSGLRAEAKDLEPSPAASQSVLQEEAVARNIAGILTQTLQSRVCVS